MTVNYLLTVISNYSRLVCYQFEERYVHLFGKA